MLAVTSPSPPLTAQVEPRRLSCPPEGPEHTTRHPAFRLAPSQPRRQCPAPRWSGATSLGDEPAHDGTLLANSVSCRRERTTVLSNGCLGTWGSYSRGPLECLSAPFPGRPFGIARVSFDGVPVPEASTWPIPKCRAFRFATVIVRGPSSLEPGWASAETSPPSADAAQGE